MTADKPDLVPGTLDMLVMRSLEGGALHGYSIARRIEQSSGDVLRVEEGSLYPALHRLEHKGLLLSEWGTSESNRRAKYYRLTTAGKKELKRSIVAWQRMTAAVADVMGVRTNGARA